MGERGRHSGIHAAVRAAMLGQTAAAVAVWRQACERRNDKDAGAETAL